MDMGFFSMIMQEVGVWGAFTIAMYLIQDKRNTNREETLMANHLSREELLLDLHQKREEVLTGVITGNQEIIQGLTHALDEVQDVKTDLQDIKYILTNAKK